MKNSVSIVLVLPFFTIVSFAQVPVISDFTPHRGGIGTPVTITGSNFEPLAGNNQVFFGTLKAVIIMASANQVKVLVPDGVGTDRIRILTRGLQATTKIPFAVTFPALNSLSQTTFVDRLDLTPVSSAPEDLKEADIDGDGKLDIITTSGNSHTINVYRNTSTPGHISFSSKVDLDAGGYILEVAIGDLDGDGKQDLVVANWTLNSISVFRNMCTPGVISSGSFAAKFDIGVGVKPQNVSIGDIDVDGMLDIIASSPNNGAGTAISILRNNYSGGTLAVVSFISAVNFTTESGPMGSALSDIDGDGKPEVFVTNYNSDSFSLFLNLSTPGTIGTLSLTRLDFSLPFTSGGFHPGAFNILLTDIDGDEKLDVISAGSSEPMVLRNTYASGTITTSAFAVPVSIAQAGIKTRVSDLDGDGKIDLLGLNDVSSISFVKNNSISGDITAGSFDANILLGTGQNSNPVWVSSADFDNDGVPDLSICLSSSQMYVTVYRNTIGQPAKQNQSITFGAIVDKTIGDAGFDLLASSSSELPVIFSTTSDKVSLTGNHVSLLKTGVVTISASQPGSNSFEPAIPVTRDFCINPPMPSISALSQGNPPYSLASTAPTGNQWYFNGVKIDGATSQILVVFDPGIYSVQVTSETCSSLMSNDFPVVVTAIEDEPGSNEGILIYPNPVVGGELTIDLRRFGDPVSIEILDSNGITIMKDEMRGGQSSRIPFAHPAGLYLIRILQSRSMGTVKFMVNN